MARRAINPDAANAARLPDGFIARGVPGDYDGSTPLPSVVHEKFAVALAGGATRIGAYALTGRKSVNARDAASKLSRAQQVVRRVSFLREERAQVMTAERAFEGFVHAVESAMEDIAELVKLCEAAGLPRETAAARNALQSLAGRTITHRAGLANADRRASPRAARAKESLEGFSL